MHRLPAAQTRKTCAFARSCAQACTDPQSGIYEANLGWGSGPALDDLVPWKNRDGTGDQRINLTEVPFQDRCAWRA